MDLSNSKTDPPPPYPKDESTFDSLSSPLLDNIRSTCGVEPMSVSYDIYPELNHQQSDVREGRGLEAPPPSYSILFPQWFKFSSTSSTSNKTIENEEERIHISKQAGDYASARSADSEQDTTCQIEQTETASDTTDFFQNNSCKCIHQECTSIGGSVGLIIISACALLFCPPIGLLALICALISHHGEKSKNYVKANKFGNYSRKLSSISVVCSVFLIIAIPLIIKARRYSLEN